MSKDSSEKVWAISGPETPHWYVGHGGALIYGSCGVH
jgi:hypothetical protein